MKTGGTHCIIEGRGRGSEIKIGCKDGESHDTSTVTSGLVTPCTGGDPALVGYHFAYLTRATDLASLLCLCLLATTCVFVAQSYICTCHVLVHAFMQQHQAVRVPLQSLKCLLFYRADLTSLSYDCRCANRTVCTLFGTKFQTDLVQCCAQ